MAALASQLISHGYWCTAARVACLIAGVSRNLSDDHDFNQDERSAYRELITTLNLSEQELRDIEWAAREELKQGKPLVQLIQDTLFGTGEWPSPSLMGRKFQAYETESEQSIPHTFIPRFNWALRSFGLKKTKIRANKI